jgi:hypothetical protein
MLEGMGMGKQASVLGGAGIAGFFASAFRWCWWMLFLNVDTVCSFAPFLAHVARWEFWEIWNMLCRRSSHCHSCVPATFHRTFSVHLALKLIYEFDGVYKVNDVCS